MNCACDWPCAVRTASEVISELRNLLVEMEAKYISNEGHAVDYEAIAQSKEYWEYTFLACELQKVDLSELGETDVLCFFVNMYNTLTIHGTIVNRAPRTALQRSSFFNSTSYLIGNSEYSLNDIEHGILRGNQPNTGSLSAPFAANDPRLAYSVRIFDPRVHFLLVCGAKSCPPVKIYTPDTIDRAMQLAAESYIADEVVIDGDTCSVSIPKVFRWFSRDFGGSETEVLSFICAFLPRQQQRVILKMLEESAEDIIVTYKEYDWSSNAGGGGDEGDFV